MQTIKNVSPTWLDTQITSHHTQIIPKSHSKHVWSRDGRIRQASSFFFTCAKRGDFIFVWWSCEIPWIIIYDDTRLSTMFKSDYKNMKTKKNNVFSRVTRLYCLLNVGLAPTGTGDESTSNGNVSSLYFSGIRLMHL